MDPRTVAVHVGNMTLGGTLEGTRERKGSVQGASVELLVGAVPAVGLLQGPARG